ncbi:MAG: hypothetical protein KUA33_03835 [Methanobacterium sp.]|nr:hypothetical protein [Methanobacterium sp.]
MNKDEIKDVLLRNIREGKNSLLWQHHTAQYIEAIEEKYEVVYINEPDPIKAKLKDIIMAISHEKESTLSRKTVPELKKILESKTARKKVVIVFNNFERITASVARAWLSISEFERVILVGSFFGRFKKGAYGLYKVYEVVNEDDMEESFDEVDITMFVFAGISVLVFLAFLRFSMEVSFKVLGAFWLAVITFRTMIFVAR